jgi:hypothetical protein
VHKGPNYVLANLSVDFKSSLSADKIELTIAELDKTIKAQQPQVKRVFIELEKISSIKTRVA